MIRPFFGSYAQPSKISFLFTSITVAFGSIMSPAIPQDVYGRDWQDHIQHGLHPDRDAEKATGDTLA